MTPLSGRAGLRWAANDWRKQLAGTLPSWCACRNRATRSRSSSVIGRNATMRLRVRRPLDDCHGAPGDAEVGPGRVVGVVALKEPVVPVGVGPQPVGPVRERGDVDVLVWQDVLVEVPPADGQAHAQAERGQVPGSAAGPGVDLALWRSWEAELVLVVIAEAEAALRADADAAAVG